MSANPPETLSLIFKELRDVLDSRRARVRLLMRLLREQLREQKSRREPKLPAIEEAERCTLQVIELLRREELLIENAFERITVRTYGVCTDCQEAIAPDELRECPFARKCLACRLASEAAERGCGWVRGAAGGRRSVA